MKKIKMFKSKKKKREEKVVKEIAVLMEKLEKNEITGQELNQELERLLYEVRMGKI